MRNKKNLLRAAVAALLLTGVVSAQDSPAQQTTTPPTSTTASAPAESPAPTASSALPPPTTLLEMLDRYPSRFSPAMADWIKNTDKAGRLSRKADSEASLGDWPDAENDYNEALTIFSDETGALYALGDHSLQKGDFTEAISYYRRAIYEPLDNVSPARSILQPPVFHENNAFRVMEYARMLSLAGQKEEAISVYRHGAHLINYQDGQRKINAIMPDFGDGPGQIAYTPKRLQALAQVGWADNHSDFDYVDAGKRLQEAVALYPDSPVPYYYRARYEARHSHDFKAVKADFDKAAQLGGADAADAVEHEEHFFRHQFEAVGLTTEPAKSSP